MDLMHIATDALAGDFMGKPAWIWLVFAASVVTLLAPGRGTVRRPAACTAWTRRAPGSLTAGVPASLA